MFAICGPFQPVYYYLMYHVDGRPLQHLNNLLACSSLFAILKSLSDSNFEFVSLTDQRSIESICYPFLLFFMGQYLNFNHSSMPSLQSLQTASWAAG